MPYRKQQFVNGEIYHIVVRRIGDDLLFKNIDDYYRGVFSIYEFNNANPVRIAKRRQEIQAIKEKFKKFKQIIRDPTLSNSTQGRVSFAFIPDGRDWLVEILAFCFMPNHIHLLLRQLQDGGISKFMQKVGAGYSAYFKEKYDLQGKGYFFHGRFVSVHIKTDDQLKIVFVYIHANPISLIEPRWKEIGIKNPKKVIKHLENYKWSSYPDCIGKKNFPSVTEREFILKVMGGEQGCKDFIENWVRYKGEIREFSDLALE